MEWIKHLNKSIDYIEKNLAGDVSYEEAARLAATSVYHYQRMFSYMADITLGEYIRRRRLSRAAEDLQRGGKVIDIAMKYGYESPTSFTRAFKAVHGINPSQAQDEGAELKSFSKLVFSIQIKGVESMDYRIETKDEFRSVGYRMPMAEKIEENFNNIPSFWNKISSEGSLQNVISLMDGTLEGVLGVSDFVPGREENYYYIAVATQKDLPKGMYENTIPSCKWAIFPGEGEMPTALQDLTKRIMSEWFPTSGFDWGEAPDIELYINADPKNSKFEIWVPIKEK